ncbi:MAG: glycoside hydrolase family 3 C-terminal domain-containing protein [Bacilli bacterium]
MKHEDILKKMTLDEKASMLSGKNFWETMDYDNYGVPVMFLSDGPHGIRKQAAAADQLGLNPSLPATCFPTAASLANTWNEELVQEIGTALGDEAVRLHVNMVLGPGLNVKRNPRCGRCFEYFSEDPYLAGKMAAGMVRGIQSNGIASCIKHFCCNSQEERRLNSDSIVDERALREIYTTGFEIAIKEGGAKSIMSSYNLVNGVYTNENMHVEQDILRNEFGFKGVVVTDWGGENDRVAGLLAGNELEMPGNNGDTDREIIKAVKEGKLDEKVVDEAADNVIDLAIETSKVFKDYKAPVGEIDGQKVTGLNCFPEVKKAHHDCAKNASDETMVLLKNDNAVLPLRKEDKVAVIGDFANAPRFQGAGSSLVNSTQLDNFTDLKNDYHFDYVGYARGFNRYGKLDEKLSKEALALATKADIIVYFMGLDEVTESEGLDRETLNLPYNQIALLRALRSLGKKIVVVLSAGSVVDLSWDVDCDALIHGALSGQAGCNSIVDILNGDVNPSGKLSETYPVAYKDVPSSANFPGHMLTVEYRESIYIGYRYYEKADVQVKYPFGYGLSYTTFEYSSLTVTEDGVKFTIKNTGKYAGKEVAQLYVGLKDSKIFRAVKELKGFHKTKLLQPGESEEVEIKFDDKSFRYFNVATMKWEIEEGTYDIYVGASSADIRLTGTIAKEGTTTKYPYDAKMLPSYYSGKILLVPDSEFKTLYGQEIPSADLHFVNDKHTRIALDRTSVFSDLVYARGWVGRLVGNGLNLVINYGNKHNKGIANAVIMGPYSFPMRAVSRMMGMPMSQSDGLMTIFDGHFFKGLSQFIKGGKEKPKYPKEDHYVKVDKKKKGE